MSLESTTRMLIKRRASLLLKSSSELLSRFVSDLWKKAKGKDEGHNKQIQSSEGGMSALRIKHPIPSLGDLEDFLGKTRIITESFLKNAPKLELWLTFRSLMVQSLGAA